MQFGKYLIPLIQRQCTITYLCSVQRQGRMYHYGEFLSFGTQIRQSVPVVNTFGTKTRQSVPVVQKMMKTEMMMKEAFFNTNFVNKLFSDVLYNLVLVVLSTCSGFYSFSLLIFTEFYLRMRSRTPQENKKQQSCS